MMNLQERSYCDQILRVDLTSGKFEITPLPGDAMPLILGGKGLGAWLLLNEQSPQQQGVLDARLAAQPQAHTAIRTAVVIGGVPLSMPVTTPLYYPVRRTCQCY